MLRALLLFTAACSALGDLPVGGKPNAIYDAQGSGRVKVKSVKNGVLYNITAPNNTHILEMHVYGTAYERGVAHGSLLATKVPTFMTEVACPFYSHAMCHSNLLMPALCDWLQELPKFFEATNPTPCVCEPLL